MPFQSEKQRRYLWANEPEIARDWTDTYGSGIAKALGGRIDFRSGGGPGPGGQGARGQATQNPGRSSGPSGPPGGGDRQMTYTAPHVPHRDTGPTVKEALATGQKKKEIRDLLARQQAEKEYTRQGVRKVGPQLSLAGSGRGGGGLKNFLGNWGSTVGGSQLGGGLGSMLFGPWGMLLGSIFGGGVGRRSWKASQTPQKETARDILMPEALRNLGLFDKRINEQPQREGIETIDIRDKFDRRGDDFSEIEGQQAKLKGLALAQYRVLQKKQAYEPYGGEKMTPKDKQFLNRLEEMMKEEKMYSLPLIG